MMKLVGTHYAYARRRQKITIAGADYGKVHGFKIVIYRGPVGFRIGTVAGAQDLVAEQHLGTGQHIIAYTPQSDVWIEFNHVGYDPSYVQSIAIVAAGSLTLTNGPGRSTLSTLRFDQSGNVIYIGVKDATKNQQQRKLIRRDTYSWSLELYEPSDGPFLGINITPTTLQPSATTGEITLTASQDMFKATHVGALFRLESIAQQTTDTLTGANQFGSSVRVSGVGNTRKLTIDITGTWVASITLQRSLGEEGLWTDVHTYTTNQTATIYDDGLDNEIAFYRLGIKTGNYTSGTATVELTFPSGSNTGICRLTAVASGTSATAVVLKAMGSTNATEDWYEGSWSDERGYPSAVAFDEGRLWWAGQDKNYGSVSDAFESFDDTVEGDSGPIQRSIGSGPVDSILWMLALQRLTLGAAGSIYTVRSSSLDEVLTPTNYGIKPGSSQGAANVQAVRVDESCLFVQRSGQRLFSLGPDQNFFSYQVEDLSILAPHIGLPGITSIAVQHQPETRVHCVRSDGTVAAFVYDRLENVHCWVEVEMGDTTNDGIVDVVVLPGDGREDHVYYVVRVGTEYVLTKWAQESECVGDSLNKQGDIFVTSEGTPISSIAVPTLLNGRTVVIWADGKDRGTAVVSAGSVALGGTYTDVMVGLSYTAQWQSAKLAFASGLGTALLQRKNIGPLGLLLYKTHRNGIKYGRDFTSLDDLPEVVDGATVAADYIWDSYDKKAFTLPGKWDTDARLCLQATAPRPVTVLAAVLGVETNDKV